MDLAVKNQSGQAITEYILLIAIIAGFFAMIAASLRKMNIEARLMKPISSDFARTYQYGHPKAVGYEEEGGQDVQYHPRARPQAGSGNFRMFISPTRTGGR